MTIEIVLGATIYFMACMFAFAELVSRKIEKEIKGKSV